MEYVGKALGHLHISARQVEYRTISNASLGMYTSSYTACVRDIAIGHLDICAGAFWDTADRRKFQVPFAKTIVSEHIYLYARQKEEEPSFWEVVLKPTRAFSPGLWALVLTVSVASSFVMAGLEHEVPEGDFSGLSKKGSLLQSLFLSALSLVNAGVSYTPQTAAGKVFALGFGFFILIAIASFTANTATILIAESQVPEVRDLADALAQGRRVCTPGGLQRTITAAHPQMGRLGIYSDHGIDAYQAGQCEVALMPVFAMRHFHSQGKLCELTEVGRPELSFSTGVFVSQRLRPHLDMALTAKHADGTWASMRGKLDARARCASRKAKTMSSDSMELRVTHMAGNCFLLLFSLGVAVALRALRWLESTRLGRSTEHSLSQHAAMAEHSLSQHAANAAHAMNDAEHEAARRALEVSRKLTVASQTWLYVLEHERRESGRVSVMQTLSVTGGQGEAGDVRLACGVEGAVHGA